MDIDYLPGPIPITDVFSVAILVIIYCLCILAIGMAMTTWGKKPKAPSDCDDAELVEESEGEKAERAQKQKVLVEAYRHARRKSGSSCVDERVQEGEIEGIRLRRGSRLDG